MNGSKTNSFAFRIGVDWTKIIIASLLLCLMFSFNAFAQNETLDEDSAAALIEELIEDLEKEVTNERIVNKVIEKWESRDLAGKTKMQAINSFFGDMLSSGVDPSTAGKLMSIWTTRFKKTNVEGPKPTPEPKETPETEDEPEPTPQPKKTPVQVSAQNCEEGFVAGSDRSCVRQVMAYLKDNIANTEIQQLTAQNGWAVATRQQVTTAWEKGVLDQFAFLRIDTGDYCVPIQKDVNSFKRGTNCGDNRGNQGFLYVLAPRQVATNPTVTNPTEPSPTEDMIDLGAPPLSDNDMTQVMKWIAVRTTAQRLPFCWKETYGRTAGTPMICKPGYNQDTAGLCYQKCQPDERGIATFCYKNCPQGLPDNGLYCEKRGEYGRGAGYVIWNEDKCNRENPQGCEKSGALWYPKCKPGYSPFGCCLCKPSCPQGWEDIGVSCKKPNYARQVLPLTECPAGTERNGALCYPLCRENFGGNGPVCWQKCPSQQSWDCGAACATNQKECAMAVLKQVTAPIMALISIVSLGSASAATAPAKAAQVAASVSKLAAGLAKVKKALTAVKGSVEALVGGAKNLANIQKAVKIGSKLYVAGSAIGREVDLFSKEFADNFDQWTSPEIAREIDQRFGKEAAFQIKRQWGLRHLTLMLEADGFATGKNVLSLVSIADPTGLVAVAEAFMQPICKPDFPFPKVAALYNR